MKTPLLSLSIGLIACAAAAAEPQAASDFALYHRFTIAERQDWGTVSVELAPHAWRIGSVDGPAPSEAQLRAVLANLGALEIGGRCAGWVDGLTLYPCGFALEALDFAGSVPARYAALGFDWEAPSESPAARAARVSDELRRSGLLAPMLGPLRFVAVKAPLAYLGDKSDAAGRRIEFRLRAVTNLVVPSVFDRASGSVILRAGRRADAEF